jgi:hypothetical protein
LPCAICKIIGLESADNYKRLREKRVVRHIVILNFQKGLYIDYYGLIERTRPYLAEIPGIISYNIFQNESKYTPQDVVSIGVEIIFKDQNAVDVFMAHPKHYEANALFEKYFANPPYMVLTHKI